LFEPSPPEDSPDIRAEADYLKDMSAETAQLLAAFEALPTEEKQSFVRELFRRLPPLDSGPLDDEEVARAGDEIAAMLDREEHDAQAR
jgi:hypothetical protein